MKLIKLSYSEFVGTPLEWSVTDLEFGDVNLFVSKNAVGKTRIVSILNNLAHRLLNPGPTDYENGRFDLGFTHNESEIRYQVDIKNHAVVEETYTYRGEILLHREANGDGELFNASFGKKGKIKIPENELLAARRDDKQYPFLSPLHIWAGGLHFYPFNTDLGKFMLVLDVARDPGLPFNAHNKNLVVNAFINGAKHLDYKGAVIVDMGKLGYEIEDIKVDSQRSLGPGVSQFEGLRVKELGVADFLDQISLSTGMFRCLSLLIQLNLFAKSGTPQCLVIDDIGEGLDYERSRDLVKLLIDKALDSDMQLIMTTNDRFIMNAVPLQYWTVLERRGGIVTFYNHNNAKDIFDEFKFTGLSNFDFFSYDFMHQEKSHIA
jgi:hypothetical protein